MNEMIPDSAVNAELLGEFLFEIWRKLRSMIEENYDIEGTMHSGGRKWMYECKYKRGGKTLCSLLARKECIGFMIIFGSKERMKAEEIRSSLSEAVLRKYDEAEVYHDGKWVMFEPADTSEFDDYLKLLAFKRKPDRKQTF